MVKDNIEVMFWPTTAGSLALADNMTNRNAPLVDRLIVRGREGFGGWLQLRWHLSLGLGGLTLLAGLL